MVKCLELEGVSTLFGYPGVAICPFYDSLRDSSIRHILTRNEQNAGHAASGYARISGKPGVCVSTSGPGATNLFTAIATAYVDSIPLIAITGQVSSELLGRDVFQEVDTTGAVEPFTKHTYLVKDPADIPRVFKEAFYIASTGRKGPVLIDMPVDVQQQTLTFSYPKEISIRGYKPHLKGHAMQIKRVAAAIKEAKRPLMCAGGGVFAANAAQAVRDFCEQNRLPLISTMMGIGIMPFEHPLYFGMIGQSGHTAANRAMQESDLLIIIGARVGDRAVSAPHALEKVTTIIHIDIDSAEIGKNVGTTIPLVGDVSLVIEQLMEQNPKGSWEEWLTWLGGHRNPQAPSQPEKEGYVEPNRFIRMLSEQLDGDAIYVADVGENQLWSARNYQIKNGRFLTTGGMGTMGYALPAAIGASLASPKQQVLAVCGDGAFQMSMMELATANQHGIPVKLVVMRNDYLGLVREHQKNRFNNREMAVKIDGGPDIGGIAAAYGVSFLRLSDRAQAKDAIRAFLDAKNSFILECVIDPQQGTS